MPVGEGLAVLGSPLRRSSGSSATTDTADGARLSSESSSQYASSSSGGRASSYGGAQMPLSEGSAEGSRALRGEILKLRAQLHELHAKNVDENLKLHEQLHELHELQAKHVESTKQTDEQIARLKEREQQLDGENTLLRGAMQGFDRSKEQTAALNTENVQLKEREQQLYGENAQLRGAAELRAADHKGLVEKTDASTKAATLLEEQLRQAKAELDRESYDSVAWSKAEKAKTQKLQEQLQTALQDGAHSKAVLMEKEKAEDTLRKETDELKQRHEKEMDAMKQERGATKEEMDAMKKEMATLREANATLQSGKDELQQGKDMLQREKNALEQVLAEKEVAMLEGQNEDLEFAPAPPLDVSQPRGVAWLIDPWNAVDMPQLAPEEAQQIATPLAAEKKSSKTAQSGGARRVAKPDHDEQGYGSDEQGCPTKTAALRSASTSGERPFDKLTPMHREFKLKASAAPRPEFATDLSPVTQPTPEAADMECNAQNANEHHSAPTPFATPRNRDGASAPWSGLAPVATS